MKWRKAVCSVLSAAMLITGAGVMSLSADATVGNVISYDDTGYWMSPVEEFVYRLYSLALQREPDTAGLESWRDVLLSKKGTGISVAYGFIYSNEFQSRDVSNEEYVELMYQMFFGRSADAAGKAGWVSVLESMGREEGRLDVFNGFANSNEFFALCNSYGITAGTFVPGQNVDRVAKINLFVDRLYDIVLRRKCDKDGMTNWTNSLLAGEITGAEAGYGFFFSQEYVNRNYADSLYVGHLYQAFLGRDGDSAGITAWSGEMALGQSREHVFNGFTQSEEFSNICNDYGIVRGGPIAEPPAGTYTTSDRLTIWSSTAEISDLAERYSSIPVDTRIITSSGGAFQAALDATLASGNDVPDLVVLDQVYSRYMRSSSTMPVSSLGITDAELADMYSYPNEYATYEGQVHGIAYYICPSVVYYNRDVAARTLGVSSPEQVAPYFESWDAFLNTARTVNSNSNGSVKVVNSIGDVMTPYLAQRSQAWTDVDPNTDTSLIGIFDLAKTLVDENLVYDSAPWMEQWMTGMRDESVLSYWGPDWLARYSMMLDPEADSDFNPTAGHWGAVRGPVDWNWGGTYIAATSYCRYPDAAGQFIRQIAMNPAVADENNFVPNSRSTLAAWASDPAHNEAMLAGQNPYRLYAQVAEGVHVAPIGNDDELCNSLFQNQVTMYAYGEVDSARTSFNIAMSSIADNIG